MQAALHQELAFACTDELDRLVRRGMTVRGIDYVEAADVNPVRLSSCGDLSGWSHQDRDNDASFRCLRCTP